MLNEIAEKPKEEQVTKEIQAIQDQDTLILIAEDDDGYFQLMKIMFNRSHVPNKIIRFTNGQEILEFLEKGTQTNFLVILDIRMPKIDGIEVLRIIKNSDKLKDIPVIIHSSTSNPATIELCNSLGCVDYIIKSGNLDEINRICNHIL